MDFGQISDAPINFEDGAETEMRASLQRMFNGGPFEAPSNLHPLYTGIELLTEPSAGALPPTLLRWLTDAHEILRQPAPPPLTFAERKALRMQPYPLSRLAKTVAGRMEQIMAWLAPQPLYCDCKPDCDVVVGEGEPLITKELAAKLLEGTE
jgi:hypothetical protein